MNEKFHTIILSEKSFESFYDTSGKWVIIPIENFREVSKPIFEKERG